MSVKLVVFDIAGTTVKDNHDVSKALSAALQQYGYDVPVAEIDPIMGYEKNLAITQLLKRHEPQPEKITPDLIRSIHTAFVQQMIRHYQTSPDIIALPNVEETFAKLHQQGILVGINTGFSRDIAQIIIARLQWTQRRLIDFLVTSDEVEAGRPEPFMIRKMMEAAGITNAAEVAKVGDTAVDMEEGHNSGCKYVIGVTTGIYTRAELEKCNPTHIVDDMATIIGIINS